ncbi:MAG TPA: hypothetical protein VMU31_07430 [Rhizomicrobium sp.]|nr:hypothetical protein [Rhizomicrobium sp.]
MNLELAEKISEVPKLYAEGDKSTARLLKEFGFPENRTSVAVEDVEAVLKRRPRLADLWLARCHDQLLAGGWGIERRDDHWRIQNFSDHRHLEVKDRIRACAEFIVRYVGFIGETQARLH